MKAIIPQFNHPDAYIDNAVPGGIFNQRFVRDWGHLDEQLDHSIVPDLYGILGRMVVKGVRPVEGPKGRALLKDAIKAHQENAVVFELAQQLTFRDETPEGEEISFEAITVHQHQEAIESSGAAIFGWGSWMDAGTADAVIRRFLTYSNNQRAVIGAWEHGGQSGYP